MITVKVLWFEHQIIPWIKSISFDDQRFFRQKGWCHLDPSGWKAFRDKHRISNLNEPLVFKMENGRSIQVSFDGVNISTGRGSAYVLVEPPTEQEVSSPHGQIPPSSTPKPQSS